MYLKTIEFVTEIPLRNDSGVLSVPLSLTQPRIFWEFTDNVIKSVIRTDSLLQIDTRRSINDYLINNSEGTILEPIVLIALKNTSRYKTPSTRLEKYRAQDGSTEIDVILDDVDEPLLLMEIKRSDKLKSNHAKNLCNPEVQNIIKKIYGDRETRRIVLYRGETLDGGRACGNYIVEYVNIEEFLTSIET